MRFSIYNIKLKMDRKGYDVIIPYEKEINDCLSTHYRGRTDIIKKFVRTVNLTELNNMYDVGEVLLSIENYGYFDTIMKDSKLDIVKKKKEVLVKLHEIIGLLTD